VQRHWSRSPRQRTQPLYQQLSSMRSQDFVTENKEFISAVDQLNAETRGRARRFDQNAARGLLPAEQQVQIVGAAISAFLDHLADRDAQVFPVCSCSTLVQAMSFLGHMDGPRRRPPQARGAVTGAARTLCHWLHRTPPGPRPPAPSHDGPSSERALSPPPSSQNHQDRNRPGKSVPVALRRRTVPHARPQEPLPLAVVAGFAQEPLKLRTKLCGMRDTRSQARTPEST
jgi:hypothetical protein